MLCLRLARGGAGAEAGEDDQVRFASSAQPGTLLEPLRRPPLFIAGWSLSDGPATLSSSFLPWHRAWYLCYITAPVAVTTAPPT